MNEDIDIMELAKLKREIKEMKELCKKINELLGE